MGQKGIATLMVIAFFAVLLNIAFLAYLVRGFFYPEKVIQSISINKPINQQMVHRIQKCPTMKVNNRMPRVVASGEVDKGDSSYFIIDGKTVNDKELDLNWIADNCKKIPEQNVY